MARDIGGWKVVDVVHGQTQFLIILQQMSVCIVAHANMQHVLMRICLRKTQGSESALSSAGLLEVVAGVQTCDVGDFVELGRVA